MSLVKLPYKRWLLVIIGLVIGVIVLRVFAQLKPLSVHGVGSSVQSAPNNGAFAPRDCNSAATCIAPPDAFLKINQFYVLFTYPIVPHLDKSGTFIVGLDALAEMISATVHTEAAVKTETITRMGHSVTFTDGAQTAAVDGKQVSLSVPALWDKPSQKMIVPLSVILQAFHLGSRWTARYRILALQDKTFFNVFTTDPDILGPIWRQEGPDYKFPDRGYLVPIATQWATRQDVYRRDLKLTAKNVSGKTLQRDKSFINFVQADYGIGGFATLRYGAGGTLNGPPDEPRLHQPSLANGKTRTADQQGVGVSGSEYSLYVLAWLNTRE